MTPSDLATLDRFLTLADAVLKVAAARAPTHATILDAALDASELRGAWEAGTLDGRRSLDLLHAVRMEGRRWLRAEAEALLAEVASDSAKTLMGGVKARVGAFFGRAKAYVRELFAAGVLAIAGPDPAVLDAPVVQEALREQVDGQLEYLEDFRRQVVAENRPLDGRFAADAEKYGSSVWNVAQAVNRAYAATVFAVEKRNHDHPWTKQDPCDECRYEAEQPWAKVGTRKRIGETPCKMNCHCYFTYKLTPDDPTEYLAPGVVFRRAA